MSLENTPLALSHIISSASQPHETINTGFQPHNKLYNLNHRERKLCIHLHSNSVTSPAFIQKNYYFYSYNISSLNLIHIQHKDIIVIHNVVSASSDHLFTLKSIRISIWITSISIANKYFLISIHDKHTSLAFIALPYLHIGMLRCYTNEY